MQIFNEIISTTKEVNTTLTLPFDLRQKSRMKVTLDSGQDASLILPRGQVLRDGVVLRAESGFVVRIVAAEEDVSSVYSDDKFSLMLVCYHLGNRHVPLEIAESYVRYRKDHVLDDMVKGLGLNVKHEQAMFEPESGAYAPH